MFNGTCGLKLWTYNKNWICRIEEKRFSKTSKEKSRNSFSSMSADSDQISSGFSCIFIQCFYCLSSGIYFFNQNARFHDIWNGNFPQKSFHFLFYNGSIVI